jgi:hypothetical protein
MKKTAGILPILANYLKKLELVIIASEKQARQSFDPISTSGTAPFGLAQGRELVEGQVLTLSPVPRLVGSGP